jgi:hypothetical protein
VFHLFTLTHPIVGPCVDLHIWLREREQTKAIREWEREQTKAFREREREQTKVLRERERQCRKVVSVELS